jgi:hypothetical protein
MATIAAAAVGLGAGLEHMRPTLPGLLRLFDETQRMTAAIGSGALVSIAVYIFPAPVAPFNALVRSVTGSSSPMLAAFGLGALVYVGGDYVHPLVMPNKGLGPIPGVDVPVFS